MKTLLALLLLIPSLSWANIKLVCQGHSMVQVLYLETGDEFSNKYYNERPTVTINENEQFILVNGASDGIMAYNIQTWRGTEDAFYGFSQDPDGRTLGYVHIDRITGEMIRMTYLPNESEKQGLFEYYYDCKKASKKF